MGRFSYSHSSVCIFSAGLSSLLSLSLLRPPVAHTNISLLSQCYHTQGFLAFLSDAAARLLIDLMTSCPFVQSWCRFLEARATGLEEPLFTLLEGHLARRLVMLGICGMSERAPRGVEGAQVYLICRLAYLYIYTS